MSIHNGNGTFGKALRTLDLLVDRGQAGIGVRQLATAMGLASSSAHRLLKMLQAEGMVIRNPDGSYAIGLEYVRLAWRATARFPLIAVAEPVLTRLVERIDETALLCVYDPGRQERMFALAVESSHPLRYVVAMNEWETLLAGASGLAILAFLPPKERQTIVNTKATSDPERLQKELDRVVVKGFAVSHGQRVHGAVGLAAPIFDASARVIGTVAFSIPEQRFESSLEDQLGQAVHVAATEITNLVGGRD